jgi:hypothetical protein
LHCSLPPWVVVMLSSFCIVVLLYLPCIVHSRFVLLTFVLCCSLLLYVTIVVLRCSLPPYIVVACSCLRCCCSPCIATTCYCSPCVATTCHVLLLLYYSFMYSLHPPLYCCCLLRCCILPFLPCVGWSLEHLESELREPEFKKKKEKLFFKLFLFNSFIVVLNFFL